MARALPPLRSTAGTWIRANIRTRLPPQVVIGVVMSCSLFSTRVRCLHSQSEQHADATRASLCCCVVRSPCSKYGLSFNMLALITSDCDPGRSLLLCRSQGVLV